MNSGARVLVLGASGTAGRAAALAMADAGHDVVAITRATAALPDAVAQVVCDDVIDTATRALADKSFDVVVSCVASRTGVSQDAWRIDHDMNIQLLDAALNGGVDHFVLLSAICVQKPRLAFQKAKLAFEEKLRAADLKHSIVRPTAFFKSVSGQVERVRDGKPFLLFGDGTLTACKPISDRDLGRFMERCLHDKQTWNHTCPVGGPGPALTLRDMGDMLFRLTAQTPRFRSVPPSFLKAVSSVLAIPGTVNAYCAAKSELARIGHYYATESMLVWDAKMERYDADATPEFGSDTLEEHYGNLLTGQATQELGAHKMF